MCTMLQTQQCCRHPHESYRSTRIDCYTLS